jgi:hypothetical protein
MFIGKSRKPPPAAQQRHGYAGIREAHQAASPNG